MSILPLPSDAIGMQMIANGIANGVLTDSTAAPAAHHNPKLPHLVQHNHRRAGGVVLKPRDELLIGVGAGRKLSLRLVSKPGQAKLDMAPQQPSHTALPTCLRREPRCGVMRMLSVLAAALRPRPRPPPLGAGSSFRPCRVEHTGRAEGVFS